MSYSDVEHFSNMISGCESLTTGDYQSPNSVYAFTVLKLHAQDAGLVAGQEGFLDHVKKGASTIKEWIRKLIAAIVSYVTGSRKTLQEQRKQMEEMERESARQEKIAANKEEYAKKIANRKSMMNTAGMHFSDTIKNLIKSAEDKEAKTVAEFKEAGLDVIPSNEKIIKKLKELSDEFNLEDLLDGMAAASAIAVDEVHSLVAVLKKMETEENKPGLAKLISGLTERYMSISEGCLKIQSKIHDYINKLYHDELNHK